MKITKDHDKLAAEEIRACEVERLGETRKKNLDKVDHADLKKMRYKIQKSSNNNKRTSSGGDTTVYLRKKTVKDFPLRQEERNLRK